MSAQPNNAYTISKPQTLEECPICYDFMVGNDNLVVTECGHKFHCNCLMHSVATNGFGCPMCRQKMMAAQTDQDGNRMTIDELDAAGEEEEESYEGSNSSDDYGNGYDEEEFYINDPRDIAEVRENFLLRGFSWLFEQQQSPAQSENSSIREDFMLRGVRWLFKQQQTVQRDESEFDGQSWSITPASLRSWTRNRRSLPEVQRQEDAVVVDEEDEEDEEDEVVVDDESDKQEEIISEKDWHAYATREQELEKRTENLIQDTKILVPYEQLMRAYLFVTSPEIFHSSYNHNTYEKIRDKMSSKISQLDLEFNWNRMDIILDANVD